MGTLCDAYIIWQESHYAVVLDNPLRLLLCLSIIRRHMNAITIIIYSAAKK